MPTSQEARSRVAERDAGTPGPRTSRRLLVGAALAVAALLAPLLGATLWVAERTAAAERERHGTTVVRRLAASASDALLAGDRIALNVLAREFTRLPGVATAALYSADNRLLAAADGVVASPSELETRAAGSALAGTVWVEQITLQESIAGYARIGLVPDAFAPTRTPLLVAVTLAAALAALALAWAALSRLDARLERLRTRLAAELGRDVDVDDAWTAIGRLLDPPPPTPEPTSVAPPDEETPSHLIVVNLFNQISLPVTEREAALAECEEALERVCRLYGGRTERLPGTGLVAALGTPDGDEAPAFVAVCAALLAARVFADLDRRRRHDGETPLALRIGVEQVVDAPGSDDDDAPLVEHLPESVSRAVTLSALARGGVVVGDAVHAACAEGDRLKAEPLESPVLRATLGPPGRAWLVRDLAEGWRDLLDRQATLLVDD